METLSILIHPYPELSYDYSKLKVNLSISSKELESYRLEDAISIEKCNGSYSDLSRVEIQKISILQDKLYHSLINIGHYMNPSIVKWNGRYLMGNSMTWGFFETNRSARGKLLFKWLNFTNSPYYSIEPYLGISSNGILKQVPYVKSGEYHPFAQFKLEDPRFVVMNQSWIHIVFSIMSPKHIAVGTVNLFIHPQTNRAELKNFQLLRYTNEVKKTQKNWSPFLYRGKILYIQSLNPMVVVDFAGYNLTYRHVIFDVMKPITKVPYNYNITWPYGTLRGGTNCIQIGKEYVGFFHSSRYSNITGTKSYVMGAYTFSASPPFRILRISPYPIFYDELFYSGPAHLKMHHWHIDYVVFAMTLSIENDDFLLSFGHQDAYGYVARLKITKVLDSLIAITWNRNMSPFYHDCTTHIQNFYMNRRTGKRIYFIPYYFCSSIS